MYEARNSKVEMECIVCGEKFEVFPSALKYRNPKYCSFECCYKHRRETDVMQRKIITKKCHYCGKEIKLIPSSVRERNFCSVECVNKYKSTLTGKDNPQYEADKHVKRICEWCKEEFEIYKCWTNKSHRNEGRFCSRACKMAWINKNRQNRVSKLEKGFAKKLKNESLVFEAQYPIKGFSIDIAFPKKKLAVEVDGEYWHSLPNVIEKDKRKDKQLKDRGWEVIHVGEKLIRNNLDKAINLVKEAI